MSRVTVETALVPVCTLYTYVTCSLDRSCCFPLNRCSGQFGFRRLHRAQLGEAGGSILGRPVQRILVCNSEVYIIWCGKAVSCYQDGEDTFGRDICCTVPMLSAQLLV